MRQDVETVQVTAEEIVHLLLEEMEAGMSPSYYSNLVPSVYDIYIYGEDLNRLRPLEQRIRDEAVRALQEKLASLNRSAESKIKLPFGDKKPKKRYEALGEWSVEFHENTDDDARENPLVIYSTFPESVASDDRVGTMTERVTKRRSDGQTSTTTTQRMSSVETRRVSDNALATIEYEDETGRHEFQMSKDVIKIGRGAADRWVDLKLNSKKDISREHVQIRHDAASGRFFLKDLSTLGTTLNGRAIPTSIDRSGGQEVDKNIEVPLPEKCRIGLAGVLALEFRAAKQK